MRWLSLSLLVLFLTTIPVVCLQAEEIETHFPQARTFFPLADRFGNFEGEPPAAPVYRGKELLGYILRTKEVAAIPAYSGKPIDVLVGVDTVGRITGAEVLEHHEPILLVGIPERKLYEFSRQHVAKKLTDRIRVGAGKREGFVNVDAITGATVTAIVVNRSIMRAVRKVAMARGIIPPIRQQAEMPATVRENYFRESDWVFLTGNGAIRRLLLNHSEVEEAFKETSEAGNFNAETCQPGQACDIFIDLYYSYLNPPTIGRNLLGEAGYNWLMGELGPGEHAIAVMANGVYSFKGSGYVRGGIFDRIQLVQGEQTILFRDRDHHRMEDVFLRGMPKFQEKEIFIIRQGYEFDPGSPWQLELLVRRQVGALQSVYTTFTAEYEIPEAYIERATPPPSAITAEEEPLWVSIWRERLIEIAVLLFSLLLLTLILIFQDWIARRPKLLTYVRNGFLLFTLIIIGWYLSGQLSVVNILAFTNAMFQGFDWNTFLVDPIVFILWTFVVVTLLLWGRGVYCGWLCPFGALQQLANELGRKLRIPQWYIPEPVHERLWAVKYLILFVLFGISLASVSTAERYAEVEPFKTAIILNFQREWPFVVYAAGLVVISAFNSKFYCKYLCPLGAGLAIPARFRLFSWLKRRKECGSPCQICANECTVQAINRLGEINANECHYCLDCQKSYWNDHKCPPLVHLRKRCERAARSPESVQWSENNPGQDDQNK